MRAWAERKSRRDRESRRKDEAARASPDRAGLVEAWLRRFAVAVLGDDGAPRPVARVSTGVPALDDALGGGVPRGRVVEIFGAPATGKSRLALAMARAAQARGGTVAIVDAERALEPARAASLGLDLARVVVVRPQSGEEAFQVVDALVARGAVELVIVDSIAALVPRDELRAPVGEAAVGLHARLLSASLRRVHGALADRGCTLVCVNQTRTTFDADGAALQTTTGGQALAFYAATRLEVLRGPAGGGVVVRKGLDDAAGRRVLWDPADPTVCARRTPGAAASASPT